MPEEVNSSSTTPNPWWDHVQHANSISPSSWLHHHNKNPNNLNPKYSSCDDDVSASTTSITNASGLTTVDQSDSSDDLLIREQQGPTHNHHLWSNFPMQGGTFLDLHSTTKDLEQERNMIMDQISSRNSSACGNVFDLSSNDYSKKLDRNSIENWRDYTNQFESRIQDFAVKNEEFSDYVNLEPSPTSVEYHHTGLYFPTLQQPYQQNGQFVNGMFHSPNISSSRNFLDIRLTRPLISDITLPGLIKPSLKSLDLSDFERKELQVNPPATKMLGITNEGKKKRSLEDVSDEVSKKPKNASSDLLPLKEPKIKFRDKVTGLQQIVSPFGKTDTASVLQESINYIKLLHEQIRLLSNPYMKNSHKDLWRGSRNRGEVKQGGDLRSRGLCLVPVSCTPQECRESGGSDYWGTPYRGCLYR